MSKMSFLLKNPTSNFVARSVKYVVARHLQGTNQPYVLPSMAPTKNGDDLPPGAQYSGSFSELFPGNTPPLSEIYLYYVYYDGDYGELVEGENAWQFFQTPVPHWGGIDVDSAEDHAATKLFARKRVGLVNMESDYCGQP
jgi:hypothetical protein